VSGSICELIVFRLRLMFNCFCSALIELFLEEDGKGFSRCGVSCVGGAQYIVLRWFLAIRYRDLVNRGKLSG